MGAPAVLLGRVALNVVGSMVGNEIQKKVQSSTGSNEKASAKLEGDSFQLDTKKPRQKPDAKARVNRLRQKWVDPLNAQLRRAEATHRSLQLELAVRSPNPPSGLVSEAAAASERLKKVSALTEEVSDFVTRRGGKLDARTEAKMDALLRRVANAGIDPPADLLLEIRSVIRPPR